MFGVSHGALQFMAYEEMKKYYISYYQLPVSDNIKLVSFNKNSKNFKIQFLYN